MKARLTQLGALAVATIAGFAAIERISLQDAGDAHAGRNAQRVTLEARADDLWFEDVERKAVSKGRNAPNMGSEGTVHIDARDSVAPSRGRNSPHHLRDTVETTQPAIALPTISHPSSAPVT